MFDSSVTKVFEELKPLLEDHITNQKAILDEMVEQTKVFQGIEKSLQNIAEELQKTQPPQAVAGKVVLGKEVKQ